MRTKVYIASPISKGDLAHNIQQAVGAGSALIKAGYAPLVPQLSCFWDGCPPKALPGGFTHEDWLGIDLPYVFVSDAVLRLPGESKGADMETALAEQAGIPVLHSVEDVLASVPATRSDKQGDLRFHGLLAQMGRLHAKKSADYGLGRDPLANLRASEDFGVPAYLGTLLRLHDKIIRLKAFAQNGSLANESAQDALMDLAAYALLVLILLDEATAKEKTAPEPTLFDAPPDPASAADRLTSMLASEPARKPKRKTTSGKPPPPTVEQAERFIAACMENAPMVEANMRAADEADREYEEAERRKKEGAL